MGNNYPRKVIFQKYITEYVSYSKLKNNGNGPPACDQISGHDRRETKVYNLVWPNQTCKNHKVGARCALEKPYSRSDASFAIQRRYQVQTIIKYWTRMRKSVWGQADISIIDLRDTVFVLSDSLIKLFCRVSAYASLYTISYD